MPVETTPRETSIYLLWRRPIELLSTELDMAVKVCFLGGARYERPLESTSEKKFRAIESIAELFVIGFSHDLRARTFTEHAHFYLLPQFPIPIFRYLELFLFGQMLLYWLV